MTGTSEIYIPGFSFISSTEYFVSSNEGIIISTPQINASKSFAASSAFNLKCSGTISVTFSDSPPREALLAF